MNDALSLIMAELEIRRREQVRAELPRWDWFGPDCGCPAEVRKSDGSCPEHPRARDKQRVPDGDWKIWYIESGRGWGKTYLGAQWVQWKVATGQAKNIALVGATAADVRDTMVGTKNPSGLLHVCPPWLKIEHQPSKRGLVWRDDSGKVVAQATLYSADEPDRLRGQNSDLAWCDEISSWRLPEAFHMLKLGLRIGANPQCVITTTPKPLSWLRAIKKLTGTVLTKGSTYENKANLAGSFIEDVERQYKGTRRGLQEIEGIDLEDTPGALWNLDLLDALRINRRDLPEQIRVVVAVDPSVADPKVSPDDDTAECGIMVGMMSHVAHPTLGIVPTGYLLADRSLKAHPKVWGEAVRNAYHEFQADLVVAEVNNGGALVATNIQTIDPSVPVKLLHASRGKQTRAEPVATMYEQRRVWHLAGEDFAQVEAQMCNWVPGNKSPDRMDALVWLFTELLNEVAALQFSESPWPDWRGD